MTWNATCQFCGTREFHLTWGSGDQIHVNCNNPKCNGYVGQIPPEYILHAPRREDH